MTPHYLLLRPDKAGDAIKTLPALRDLKAKKPEAKVTVFASKHNISILEAEPGIRASHDPAILKETYDIAVNLLADPFDEVEAILSDVKARAKYSVQSTDYKIEFPGGTPAEKSETANIAWILSQAVGIPINDSPSAAPHLLEADHAEAKTKLGEKKKRWIGFCPFAGNANRTHPLSNWLRFFPHVADADDTEYFLFGAPSDRQSLDELAMTAPFLEKVRIQQPSHFRALGAYLKRMDGIVAVDSGPLHMALALGVPSLGFMSGGDRQRWFPQLSETDLILNRGLLLRYPSSLEMRLAYRRWFDRLFQKS